MDKSNRGQMKTEREGRQRRGEDLEDRGLEACFTGANLIFPTFLLQLTVAQIWPSATVEANKKTSHKPRRFARIKAIPYIKTGTKKASSKALDLKSNGHDSII